MRRIVLRVVWDPVLFSASFMRNRTSLVDNSLRIGYRDDPHVPQQNTAPASKDERTGIASEDKSTIIALEDKDASTTAEAESAVITLKDNDRSAASEAGSAVIALKDKDRSITSEAGSTIITLKDKDSSTASEDKSTAVIMLNNKDISIGSKGEGTFEDNEKSTASENEGVVIALHDKERLTVSQDESMVITSEDPNNSSACTHESTSIPVACQNTVLELGDKNAATSCGLSVSVLPAEQSAVTAEICEVERTLCLSLEKPSSATQNDSTCDAKGTSISPKSENHADMPDEANEAVRPDDGSVKPTNFKGKNKKLYAGRSGNYW